MIILLLLLAALVVLGIVLAVAVVKWLFILAVVALCFWLMHRLIASPLGRAFLAIRENDVRASLIGRTFVPIHIGFPG